MLRVFTWILLTLFSLSTIVGCSESLPTAGQTPAELSDRTDYEEALQASTSAFNDRFPGVEATAEGFKSIKDVPLSKLSPTLLRIVRDYGTFLDSGRSNRPSKWILFTSDSRDPVLVQWRVLTFNCPSPEERVLLTMLG